MSDYSSELPPKPFDVERLRIAKGRIVGVQDRYGTWTAGRWQGVIPAKPEPATRRDRYPKVALLNGAVSVAISATDIADVRRLDGPAPTQPRRRRKERKP